MLKVPLTKVCLTKRNTWLLLQDSPFCITEQKLSFFSVCLLPSCMIATVRPQHQHHKFAASTICALLHRATPFHLACGAKFGCNYLLCDGLWQEQHAFAGLRIVVGRHDIPSAYSLAGYVRCLNTAGKLTLLGTVEWWEEEGRDGNTGAVFKIVDLALKKILTTSMHQRCLQTKVRQLVGANLDKSYA